MKKNLFCEKSLVTYLYLASIALYIISILFINYVGRVWYSFDMYSDMLVAEKMTESLSIFPADWIFGNQLYVVSTSVIAGILNLVFHNGFYAMATASSIMMILILLCFVWLCKPFLEKKYIIIGIFCLSGAIVLGNSASQFTQGFQIIYTMASYYSCYIIGILFHLGIYIRMISGKKVHPVLFVIAALLAFALGMQSLRQTLVLYIPILIFDVITLIGFAVKNKKIKIKNYNCFSLLCIFTNVLGYLFVKILPIRQYTIISPVAFCKSWSELYENFQFSYGAFFNMTGLSYCTYGIKWIPLFVCSCIICLFVITAIVLIIKNKDTSPEAKIIIFSVISILCVMIVGVFIFRIRAIYLFVWFITVVFSVVYVVKRVKRKKISVLVTVMLLLVSGVNYALNFGPDFLEFPTLYREYKDVVNELENDKINCIYVDFNTSPIIAACSDDKIISGTVCFDYDSESNGLLYPSKYLTDTELFINHSKYSTYVVFSNWTMDALDREDNPEYKSKLFSKLDLVKEKQLSKVKYYFYKIKDESLIDYSILCDNK